MQNLPYMKQTLHAKTFFTLLFFLFFTATSFAQLANFTLTVTPTPQTCLGNGSLTFTVAGITPGSTIDYNVYLLPNTTVPVATTTTNSVVGLVAGNYQVVATQSLGGQTNTSTATATIINNVVLLTFTPVPTHVRCGNDGKITVNVLTGTAVSYEINAGPVTAPAQASNVFNNLPTGLYQVRVFDNCGEAVVVSVTLIQLTTNINIDPVIFPGGELPSCTTINIQHHYYCLPSQDIFFPLTFQYTVTPPGGGTAIIVTQTVTAGGDDNQIVSTIPFYHNQQYTYNLKITDACGNVYTKNNNIVNQKLTVAAIPAYPNCDDQYFQVIPNNYFGAFTLNFTSAPEGFVPADFNDDYPNYANGDEEIFFGGAGNAVPSGSYTVGITDSCGHTATFTFEVDPPDVNPNITVVALCGSTTGTVTILVPGRFIEAIEITAGPPGFTVPQDVFAFVNAFGAFEMANLPLGTYVFEFTDSCGDEYTETIIVQPGNGGPNVNVAQHPGCAEGEGSVRLSAEGSFETVIITQTTAPDFNQQLPLDVSANIAANGAFYMNSLPAGTYTFFTVDECGTTRTKDVVIEGYHEQINNFTIEPHCGSFYLNAQHLSNGYLEAFFLQKYNAVTGTWGHPYTGVAYTEGTLPANANSLTILNNQLNLDIQSTGQFRVLKVYYVYSNGVITVSRCIKEVYNFEFLGLPVITNVYGFPCVTGLTEVIVEVFGVPPFNYSITTKDGLPFPVDNGSSNLFAGLEEGLYNFSVTDDCGNIVNQVVDISELAIFGIEQTGSCEGETITLTIPSFSFVTYQWYAQDNPGVILSNTETLTIPSYNSATDAGNYVLVVSSSNPNSCINQTLIHPLLPNVLPNAGTGTTALLCNDGSVIDLSAYLTAPFDAGGIWQNVSSVGTLTGSMLNTTGIASGTYQFKYIVSGTCNLTDDTTVTITIKEITVAPVITPVASICDGGNIQLNATAPNGAIYQWTGPNGFTSSSASPVISNAGVAASGTYSVMVTVDGCPSPLASVAVNVKPIPQFTLQGAAQLCTGQSTVLSVVPANFTPNPLIQYTWFHNGIIQPDATTGDVEVSETGVYLVIVNNDGCTSAQQVIVSPNAFDITVEGGCVNYEYIISVTNQDEMGDAAQYSWTGPDNFSFNGPEATITNLATGDYVVTVVKADGCTATATLPVENTSCIIPKGISPNADGFNDSFDLSNLDVRHLKIFNRYGLKVYERAMYLNEWYGQSDKGDLVTGTYYYVITLSAGKEVTGWVYLQRELN